MQSLITIINTVVSTKRQYEKNKQHETCRCEQPTWNSTRHINKNSPYETNNSQTNTKVNNIVNTNKRYESTNETTMRHSTRNTSINNQWEK